MRRNVRIWACFVGVLSLTTLVAAGCVSPSGDEPLEQVGSTDEGLSAARGAGADTTIVGDGTVSPVASLLSAPAACRTFGLTATKQYSPSRWTDSARVFLPSFRFTFPSELPVTAGNAGTGRVTVQYRRVGYRTVECHYEGGADLAHPTTPAQVAKGLRYVFGSCDFGIRPGDTVIADEANVHVDDGDSYSPSRTAARTTASLVLTETGACNGGGADASADATTDARDTGADARDGSVDATLDARDASFDAAEAGDAGAADGADADASPACIPALCDDGNACTVDACGVGAACTHTPVANGTSCSNGNACDGVEICGAGVCVPGTPPVVDDGNACTTDTCDVATGPKHTPVAAGTSCSDGNACNGAETCGATGVCSPGPAPSLDDGNSCTADACSATGGVTHTPVVAGTSCSDGNACNGAETCNGSGACAAGVAPIVDDGNVCTVDACTALGGVTHTPASVGTSCSDGNACNGAEACNGAGACAPGTPLVVDDANVCTTDSCDVATGVQHTPVATGTACSDGNACNGAETCNAAGMCAPGSPPVVDDGNPCTADACSASGGVTHTPVSAGTSCSDGDACNGAEVCNGAGACAAGTPLMVDDGNACTTDACDAILGATHVPTAQGSSCSDGNACNGAEVCNGAGVCASGMAPVVDDGNPCTVDACDVTTGVSHVPAAAGTSCSDGNVCNGNEVCNAAQCETGTPLVVDDSNSCTTDVCDPVLGASHTRIDGCVPSGSAGESVFERRASFFGAAVLADGTPAQGISVSVFNDGDSPVLRNDVSLSAAADGSFRVRLTSFPESVPANAAAQHLIVRVHAIGALDAVRDLYVSPRTASDIGRIQLVAQDAKETVIGPEGGRATDSQGLYEVVIPPGALAAPVPVHITPLPARESLPLILPAQTMTTYAVDLSPEGTRFAAPVTVRVANSRNLPTAMEIPVGYADLNRARWMHVDTARWDGTRFAFKTSHFSTYDVNALTIKTEWVPQVGDGPDPGNSEQVPTCSTAGLANGTSRQSIPLVGYQRYGRNFGVNLSYDGYQAGQTILQPMNGAGASTPATPAPGPTPAGAFPSSGISRSVMGVAGYEKCVARSGGGGASFVSYAACSFGAGGGTGSSGGGSPGTCTPGSVRALQAGASVSSKSAGTSNSGGNETQVTLPLDESGNLSGPYFEARHFNLAPRSSALFGSGGPFGGSEPVCAIGDSSGILVPGQFGYDRFTFVNHRNASAFGIGWSPAELRRLYVDPYGGQAVVVQGNGDTEHFSPRAYERPITATSLTVASVVLARDPLTGEVFTAEGAPQNAIRKLGISGATATMTPVSTVAFPSVPTSMAIAYVAGVRHFVVATGTALLDIPSTGGVQQLATRTPIAGGDTTRTYPQVAAIGSRVYYHDGIPTLATAGGPKLLRWQLDAPAGTALSPETLTGTSQGEQGIDHEARLGGVQFTQLSSLAPSHDGALYVLDRGTAAVYKVAPASDGTVGPDSRVERVVGDGYGGYVQFDEDKIPGKGFSLPDAIGLSVSPDGALWIVNGFGAAVWTPDPAKPLEGYARWMVSTTGSHSELTALYFDQKIGFLAESSTSLVAHNLGQLRRYVVDEFSSEQEPTRTLQRDVSGAVTLTDTKADTIESYDALGLLVGIRERAGNTILTVEYEDANGKPRLRRIVDPSGDATTFSYDATGHIASLVDGAGRTTTFTVDDQGDLRSIVDPSGETQTFTYAGHKLTEKKSSRGEVTQYRFTSNGTLEGVTRSDGTKMAFSPAYTRVPDASGYSGEYTDDHGVVHTFRMNAWGARTSDSFTADGTSYVHVWRRTGGLETPTGTLSARRDLFGRVANETLNGLEYGDETTYDEHGRPSRVSWKRPNDGSNLIAYKYDDNGRIASITPVNRSPRIFSYLPNGRLQSTSEATTAGGSKLESWTFGNDGLLATATSAGVTTSFTYDAKGNLATSSDGSGRVGTLSRDAAGNVTRTEDGLTFATFEYDSANRMTVSKDAEGNSTTYSYERAACGCATDDLVTGVHTPDLLPDQKWTFAYGPRGRLTDSTDPTGATWHFEYTPTGELATVRDPLGRTETRSFDSLGRLSTVIDALGRARKRAHLTPSSTSWTTGMGSGLLAAGAGATAPSTSASARLEEGEYQIGSLSLDLTQVQDTSSTVSRTLGLIGTTAYRDATFAISYQYTYNGRGSLMSENDRTGVAVDASPTTTATGNFGSYLQGNYTYLLDSAGDHFSSLTAGGYPGTNVGYEASGVSFTQDVLVSGAQGWGNLGTPETYIRDAYQRIKEIRHTYDTGATPIRQSTVVTYRADGRLATKSDLLESVTYTKETFAYDARGLVSKRTIDGEGDYTYGYDELGRSEGLVFPDGHERHQQYDDAGRITSRCYKYPGTSLAARCYTASYDSAGNVVQLSDPEGVDVVDSDALGRLTGVTRGTTPTQVYAYNSLGAVATNAGVALDTKRPRLDTPSALVDSAIPNTIGGQPVTVDPGGRVTQLRGTQFQANRRGYITIVTNPDGTTARHGYDPMMRRTLYRPSVGTAEYYVYGGANLEASLRQNASTPAETYLFDGVDHPPD